MPLSRTKISRLNRYFFTILLCGCVALLVLSSFPHAYAKLRLAMMLASLPLAMAVGYLTARATRQSKADRNRRVRRLVLVCLGTAVLLFFHVPLRLAFLCNYPWISEAPQLSQSNFVSGPVQLGMYRCDTVEDDARGGVYFRLGTFAEGFGPDVLSHGFAYKANAGGTPFGNARYRTMKLGFGWSYFEASDDW